MIVQNLNRDAVRKGFEFITNTLLLHFESVSNVIYKVDTLFIIEPSNLIDPSYTNI